ncbi:hypothetical protein CAEBREN_06972 [Caenorhabditis brenneri]|uniref:RING-type domain-containing protein n=1 Tax=Caenorhabditis brenneri TaxID=135651 RepID=G0NC10_CAEBE|nr:hypothetical protein CAEBREN_06972 [Caenorhabditis brenneri]
MILNPANNQVAAPAAPAPMGVAQVQPRQVAERELLNQYADLQRLLRAQEQNLGAVAAPEAAQAPVINPNRGGAFRPFVAPDDSTTNNPIDDILSCSVCFLPYSDTDPLRKPQLLVACGHSFCTQCFNSIDQYRNFSIPMELARVICPTCRTLTMADRKQLPSNWSLMNLISERKKQKALEPVIVEDPAVPCVENAQHEASVYCKECAETYCESCFITSHKPKVMSGHTKLPVTDKPTPPYMCPQHPEREAEFICQTSDCNEFSNLLCSECLLTHHKDHDTVDLLPRIEENSKYLKSLSEDLYNQKVYIEALLKGWTEGIESLAPDSQAMINKKKYITDFFDKLKQKVLDNLTKEKDSLGRARSHLGKVTKDLILCSEFQQKVDKALKRKEWLDVKEVKAAEKVYQAHKKDETPPFNLNNQTLSDHHLRLGMIVLDSRVTRQKSANSKRIIEEESGLFVKNKKKKKNSLKQPIFF